MGFCHYHLLLPCLQVLSRLSQLLPKTIAEEMGARFQSQTEPSALLCPLLLPKMWIDAGWRAALDEADRVRSLEDIEQKLSTVAELGFAVKRLQAHLVLSLIDIDTNTNPPVIAGSIVIANNIAVSIAIQVRQIWPINAFVFSLVVGMGFAGQ